LGGEGFSNISIPLERARWLRIGRRGEEGNFSQPPGNRMRLHVDD
jgi:hypothetical protein